MGSVDLGPIGAVAPLSLILESTDAESGGSDRASNNALIAVISMPLYSYGSPSIRKRHFGVK